MTIDEIIQKFGAVIFLDSSTELLIAWNGEIQFEAFAGRFNGKFDHIDTFYKMVKTLGAAKIAAQSWLDKQSTLNPGP